MKVKITYLQMLDRPERAVPPPRDGLAVVHAKRPTVAYYRFLYDSVGGITVGPAARSSRTPNSPPSYSTPGSKSTS
jgi:hypothetical protein